MHNSDINTRDFIEPENGSGNNDTAGMPANDAGDQQPVRPSFWIRFWRSFKKGVVRLTKPFHPFFRKIGNWYMRNFGKTLSPSFFVMLFLSFMMWIMIKMGYTYTSEIPVLVNIEGHEVKVTCVVEAEGYNIFANRHYKRRKINLKWSDVEVTPSAVNPEAVVVSPYSLQNAISVRKPDIKRIISVGSIPEIVL